ncbi:MAG TPA: diaminopimelate epimerase [Methanocorpusculum sp.]|nr:diaminopimelate epimerase [Methanocorpusculum sp.]HJJ53253.1 diaminopimelate epimerase [Methanocorpusculum sp.]
MTIKFPKQDVMSLTFTKLHGNGNDFILIDEMNQVIIPDEMKAQFAVVYCDRRFGIGADGVLFISKSDKADIRMRLFQPDSSEAEMCGNGIRCLAKYAFDKEHAKMKAFKVETLAGIMQVRVGYDSEGDFMATINMGKAVYQESCEIDGMTVYSVNTGVPHAVIFVGDVEGVDINEVAPAIRHHKNYPKGTNVNFVQITGQSEIAIRTFERGIEEETLSCGTGSVASALIAAKTGKVHGEIIRVNTIGGPLEITVGDIPLMAGPAVTVFVGEIQY